MQQAIRPVEDDVCNRHLVQRVPDEGERGFRPCLDEVGRNEVARNLAVVAVGQYQLILE